MKYRRKPGKLRNRIISFYFILIGVALSFVALIINFIYIHRIEEDKTEYITTLAEINADSINLYLTEVLHTIEGIALNHELVNNLNKEQDDSQEDSYYIKQEVKDQLSSIAVVSPYINDIYLLTSDYRFNLYGNPEEIPNYNSPTFKRIYKSAMASPYLHIGFIPLKKSDYLYTKNVNNDLLVYFPIIDRKTNEKLAVMVINYNYKQIQNIITRSHIKEDYNVTLRSQNGLEIINRHSPSWGDDVKKSIEVTQNIPAVGWTLSYTISLDELLGDLHYINYMILFIIFVTLAVSLVFSIGIAYRLTSSIEILTHNMKHFGKGNLSLRIDEELNSEELELLRRGFNKMTKRIQNLVQVVYTCQLKEKDATIEALQAKINPHFLYNSLQLISSLASLNRLSDIHRAVKHLSNLYAYALYDEKGAMVPIYKELGHIEDYLSIQNLRFDNAFDVRMDVDSNLLSLEINKLILQPIIENCIKHGFKGVMKEKKIILLKAFVKNNKFYFTIVDNGQGMTSNELHELNKKLSNTDFHSQKSIGLSNVHHRIQLQYGKSYGLDVQSTKNCYTKVTITLPYNHSS